jgi:competence protein ComEA
MLRRLDQAAVAGLCLFALVAIAIYWIAQGGLSGRLIEIDRVEKLTANFQVDLNTAELPELITLPDIGPAIAQRILDYRKQYGPFTEVAELRRVKGIGPKTFERLKPYLLPIAPPPAAAN